MRSFKYESPIYDDTIYEFDSNDICKLLEFLELNHRLECLIKINHKINDKK